MKIWPELRTLGFRFEAEVWRLIAVLHVTLVLNQITGRSSRTEKKLYCVMTFKYDTEKI